MFLIKPYAWVVDGADPYNRNNKFGHPKKEVIQKLMDKNVKIYRTDLNGEIYMKLYKNGKVKIKSIL